MSILERWLQAIFTNLASFIKVMLADEFCMRSSFLLQFLHFGSGNILSAAASESQNSCSVLLNSFIMSLCSLFMFEVYLSVQLVWFSLLMNSKLFLVVTFSVSFQ